MTPLEICKASYRVGMKISTPYGTETVLTKDDIDGIFIYPTGSIYTTDGLYMLFDISDGEYAVILPKESKQLTYLLVKQGEDYKLYGEDDSCIATTMKSPYQRLSKQNCDEIFGVFDVDVFIDEMLVNRGEHISRVRNKIYGEERDLGRECFNKAMELNKDKLFTAKDMFEAIMLAVAFESCGIVGVNTYNELKELAIERALKPTEIEVRIAMGCSLPNGCTEPDVECTCEPIPSLDENGCLILWVLNTKNK